MKLVKLDSKADKKKKKATKNNIYNCKKTWRYPGINVSNICKGFVDIITKYYKSCQWIMSQYHKDTNCPQINLQIQYNSR